jgi:hypothetical protein
VDQDRREHVFVNLQLTKDAGDLEGAAQTELADAVR